MFVKIKTFCIKVFYQQIKRKMRLFPNDEKKFQYKEYI